MSPEQIDTEDHLTHHFRSQELSSVELIPHLYNSYSRYYFVSADQRFRLTLDCDQHFGIPYHFDSLYTILHADPTLILELKFDESEHHDRGKYYEDTTLLKN